MQICLYEGVGGRYNGISPVSVVFVLEVTYMVYRTARTVIGVIKGST
ncbi:hypothetical protein [Bacillus paranthracis]